MDDIRSKTAKGVLWSAVERYSLQGVQFILGLIMARLLTPEDYGLIGMLAIFLSISQVFIDGGFSNALIRNKKRTDNDFHTVFHINLCISILAYLILFFCAPYIAAFYHQPLLIPITRVYALNLIINSLVAVHKVKLVVAVDFKTQSKISLFSALLSGVIGIVCAYCGTGVWALVIQIMLNSVLSVLSCYYYVRWRPRMIFSRQSFKNLFSYGSKLLLSSIIHAIYSNIYKIVIGRQFSSASLGYYTRAGQFATFAGENISGILQRVSFPIFSEIQDDDERLVRAYKKYIQMVTWATFPIILGLCGVAKPFILVLLTEKWAQSIPYLQILCFAMLWDCVTLVNLNLLYVKGHSDWVLRLEIVKKSIGFGILFATMSFGIYVMCIGKAIYSLVAYSLNTHYTRKLFNYGFIQQQKEMMPQLLLALVMLGGCLVVTYLIVQPFVSLVASIIVGVGIYWTGSHVFRLEGYVEFCKIVKSKLKK